MLFRSVCGRVEYGAARRSVDGVVECRATGQRYAWDFTVSGDPNADLGHAVVTKRGTCKWRADELELLSLDSALPQALRLARNLHAFE